MLSLSTGTSETRGGLEKYVFRTPLFGVMAVVERGEELLNALFCGLYTLSPRPDPRDILSSTLRVEGEEVEVELIIRRGHYEIARILDEHEGEVRIEASGRVTCSCHPEEVEWVVRESLPKYGREICQRRSRD